MFSTNNLLIEASSTGNLDKVKELLDNGGNVYARGRKNNTLVHFAAMNGHLNVVQELLKRGASIHAQNSDDLTSFELVNDQNQLKVVNFLLNYQDNYGKTLLYYAIINRNHKLIDLLLEKGTDVNVQDKKGNTPLHVVARHGQLDTVKYLLERGAKTHAKNNVGNTPLHVAARYGQLAVVKKLLDKRAYIDARNNYDLTFCKLANRESKLEIVNFPFNCKDNHSAAENNNTNLISPLLGKEAEVDDKDSYNETDYIKGEVTSRASSPFSLVNSLLSWVKNSISGLLSSRAALPETSANYSNIAGTNQFSSEVCISNNVDLGFFLLQSFLDKKYSLPKFCSVTHEEALADTLNIVEKFEKTLKKNS